MNNFMLIQYDPFVMESRVFIVQDSKIIESKVSSNVNSLAQDLVATAYMNDIYTIKFNAPNAICEVIKDEVSSIEATTYGENKINMEIE